MPKIVTPEEFWDAMPLYVEHAHLVATKLFNLAVSNPSSGIQLRATVFDTRPPNFKRRVWAHDRIAKLWGTPGKLLSIEADFPVDNGRIALEDTSYNESGKQLRVWAYDVPRRNLSNDISSPGATYRETSWIASRARDNIANLTMPGYIFMDYTNHPYLPDDRRRMLAYACTDGNGARRRSFTSAAGVANLPATYFIDAIAPPYTEPDRILLEGYSLETYHTSKITTLLAYLGHVAEHGAR
jgi:hypothetical protein